MEMKIAGDRFDTLFESLGGLVAWGRAEIQKGLPRVQVEQGDNGLGADVLRAAGTGDIGFRRFEKSFGDFGCGFGTELAVPFVEEPFGFGKGSGDVGPFNGVAIG